MAATDDAMEHRGSGKRWVWTLVVLLALASAPRVAGIFTDFWLDEIWTLELVKTVSSPLEVFTKVTDSNHHHLNTLFCYLLGTEQPWAVYRLLSLLAGIGSVGIAYLIGRESGRTEATLGAVLLGGSYLMIHFSTEARGYASVVFFALLAWYAARRFARRGAWGWAVALWATTALGFLSHLMYLHAFVGIGLWLVVHLLVTRESRAGALAAAARAYGVPVLLAAAFYFLVYRRMELAGSPERELLGVLSRAFSLAGGGPLAGPLAAAVGIVFAALLLVAIVRLARERDTSWVLYLVVVLVSPGIVLAMRSAETAYVRYFLLSFAFGYLAVAHLLAVAWRAGHGGRIAAGLVVLLFLAGNALGTSRFLRYGHGGYAAAVRYMGEHTPGPIVSVASDDDFRHWLLLAYYRRVLPAGKKLGYLDRGTPRARGPAWILHHRFGELGEVAPTIRDRSGDVYDLAETWRYCGLSGWNWMLYENRRR